VARGIAQEMARDERVVLIGEDVAGAGAGGVFKTTQGLLEQFGPRRVIDTPIAEQAILGAAMGAAMTGMRPIAEIMFSDFVGPGRQPDGQDPLHDQRPSDDSAGDQERQRWRTAVRCSALAVDRELGHGGTGDQGGHAVDTRGRRRAHGRAVRCDDPVLFFEHKGLYATKDEVPEGAIEDTVGTARVRRRGEHATVAALGLMVPRALQAAEQLSEKGIDVEVIDVRSLIPLDSRTILESVGRTGRLFTVEENPRALGWGAEIASIVSDEAFWDLDGPVVRITTPHVPLPSADSLEDLVIPSVDRIVANIEKAMQA
jgi:pyruvate/2-oxoglutarate/acetoin dehydrogenase E1 component